AMDLQFETVLQEFLQHQRDLFLCRVIRNFGVDLEARDLRRIGREFGEPARPDDLSPGNTVCDHNDLVEPPVADPQRASGTNVQRRHEAGLRICRVVGLHGCDFEFRPDMTLREENGRNGQSEQALKRPLYHAVSSESPNVARAGDAISMRCGFYWRLQI